MDYLFSVVMGSCVMMTRRSPDILTVDQFYNFVKVSSVESSRQTGQESPLL